MQLTHDSDCHWRLGHDCTCEKSDPRDAEIARLTAALERAVSQVSDLSTKLGRAEGKLLASETHGVVEGWKRRAEAAEKALAAAEARPAALVAGAYEAAVEAIEALPRRQEPIGGQMVSYVQIAEAITAIRALAQKEAGE